MLNANRFSADMSVFDNKESAWDFTLKPFHDHAYITIRFAKNVPGTINSFSDIQNAFCFCHLRKCFIIFLANSVDPDQTAHREGAQWLSGRVLDSRPKGRGFEPHRRHCVVSLSKTHFILA